MENSPSFLGANGPIKGSNEIPPPPQVSGKKPPEKSLAQRSAESIMLGLRLLVEDIANGSDLSHQERESVIEAHTLLEQALSGELELEVTMFQAKKRGMRLLLAHGTKVLRSKLVQPMDSMLRRRPHPREETGLVHPKDSFSSLLYQNQEQHQVGFAALCTILAVGLLSPPGGQDVMHLSSFASFSRIVAFCLQSLVAVGALWFLWVSAAKWRRTQEVHRDISVQLKQAEASYRRFPHSLTSVEDREFFESLASEDDQILVEILERPKKLNSRELEQHLQLLGTLCAAIIQVLTSYLQFCPEEDVLLRLEANLTVSTFLHDCHDYFAFSERQRILQELQ